MKIGLIGYGAIGEPVAHAILNHTHGLERDNITLVSIFVQSSRPSSDPCFKLITTSWETFISSHVDLIVECAGQQAIQTFANNILDAKKSLLITSIGALTDSSLFKTLQATAKKNKVRILLASGAMPGVNWMASSSLAGGTQIVKVIQAKPPKSWKGAKFDPSTKLPAPDDFDFDCMTERTVIFAGSARECASTFPKNSNVTALLALATSGLDSVVVELVADPTNFGLQLEYEGGAGSITIAGKGKQSPSNPRTSAVVPLSVIKSLRNLTSTVAIGV